MPRHERAPVELDDATIAELDFTPTCDSRFEVGTTDHDGMISIGRTDRCGERAPIAVRCRRCQDAGFSCTDHIAMALAAGSVACGKCGLVGAAQDVYEITVL